MKQASFVKFLQGFLPYDYVPEIDPIYEDTKLVNGDGESFILGSSEDLDLVVYEFKHEFKTDPRVSFTKEVVYLMQKTQSCSNALVVFYNPASPQWRLSLITTGVDYENGKIVKKLSQSGEFITINGRKVLDKKGNRKKSFFTIWHFRKRRRVHTRTA